MRKVGSLMVTWHSDYNSITSVTSFPNIYTPTPIQFVHWNKLYCLTLHAESPFLDAVPAFAHTFKRYHHVPARKIPSQTSSRSPPVMHCKLACFSLLTTPVPVSIAMVTCTTLRGCGTRNHHGGVFWRDYSLSNVIMVDEKYLSFHEYLRYSHKRGNIVFSTPSAIIWA